MAARPAHHPWRSLSQISRGCGVSSAFIVNLAHQHGVPVQGPSRCSTTALSANKGIPRILIPALATQGGWERLQRLPAIAQCESLTAETVVGARHAVLGVQVSLIERDLGGLVLARATKYTPHRLTPLGKKVVAAVQTLQARGGPVPDQNRHDARQANRRCQHPEKHERGF